MSHSFSQEKNGKGLMSTILTQDNPVISDEIIIGGQRYVRYELNCIMIEYMFASAVLDVHCSRCTTTVGFV